MTATAAAGAAADVNLAVLPGEIRVEQGQVFEVELTVTPEGSAFNGYDAVVAYDPTFLTFLERPRAEQEGPLMTDACSNTFHSFSADSFTGVLSISHILLCAGANVSGPGVVYRLQFRADVDNTTTPIRLVEGTAFYLAGLYVTPVVTTDAEVRVGIVSGVPEALGVTHLAVAPNPFNPQTTISFVADAPARAIVSVLSPQGTLVAELLDQQVGRGPRTVVWDGRDTQGRRVGSGVYVVRLQLGQQQSSVRVTVIK